MDCTSPKEKGRHGKRHTVHYILLHNHVYKVGGEDEGEGRIIAVSVIQYDS